MKAEDDGNSPNPEADESSFSLDRVADDSSVLKVTIEWEIVYQVDRSKEVSPACDDGVVGDGRSRSTEDDDGSLQESKRQQS